MEPLRNSSAQFDTGSNEPKILSKQGSPAAQFLKEDAEHATKLKQKEAQQVAQAKLLIDKQDKAVNERFTKLEGMMKVLGKYYDKDSSASRAGANIQVVLDFSVVGNNFNDLKQFLKKFPCDMDYQKRFDKVEKDYKSLQQKQEANIKSRKGVLEKGLKRGRQIKLGFMKFQHMLPKLMRLYSKKAFQQEFGDKTNQLMGRELDVRKLYPEGSELRIKLLAQIEKEKKELAEFNNKVMESYSRKDLVKVKKPEPKKIHGVERAVQSAKKENEQGMVVAFQDCVKACKKDIEKMEAGDIRDPHKALIRRLSQMKTLIDVKRSSKTYPKYLAIINRFVKAANEAHGKTMKKVLARYS